MQKITIDTITHYTLLDNQARAQLILSPNIANEAKRLHHASNVCAAALARAMNATLFLSGLMKNEDDKITLSIDGGGICGRIVCVGNEKLEIKGLVDYPQVELPLYENKIDVGFAVGNKGRLSVIMDSSLSKQPYIGFSELVSGEIADDLAYYFTASMQNPSLVALSEVINSEGNFDACGGLLIQPLPFCSEAALQQLEQLSKHINEKKLSEILKECSSMEEFENAIFKGLDYVKVSEKNPICKCDCNIRRIEKVIISLGTHEMQSMIEEQDGAEIACHFCNTIYKLTSTDLKKLLKSATTL